MYTTYTTSPPATVTDTPALTSTFTPPVTFTSTPGLYRLYTDSLHGKEFFSPAPKNVPSVAVWISSWLLPLGVVAATLAGIAAVAVLTRWQRDIAPRLETQEIESFIQRQRMPEENRLLESGS